MTRCIMCVESSFHFRSLASILALAATLSACADLNDDDWRRKRVQEEVEKITKIAGVYRGTLLARATGEPIAPIEIEIASDIELGKSGNQLYSEQHAGIRGLLTVQGKRKSVVALKSGSYDSEVRMLKATATIRMKNGDDAVISVTGTIDETRFSGQIDSNEFPESGGQFELLRDGPLPAVDAISGPRSPRGIGDPAPESFTAVWPQKSQVLTAVNMGVFVQPLSSEQGLLDLFFPVKLADVSLNFGNDFVIFFPNAKWDLRTNKLAGEAAFESTRVTLDCDEIVVEGNQRGWRCNYFTPMTGPVPLVFKPNAS